MYNLVDIEKKDSPSFSNMEESQRIIDDLKIDVFS